MTVILNSKSTGVTSPSNGTRPGLADDYTNPRQEGKCIKGLQNEY